MRSARIILPALIATLALACGEASSDPGEGAGGGGGGGAGGEEPGTCSPASRPSGVKAVCLFFGPTCIEYTGSAYAEPGFVDQLCDLAGGVIVESCDRDDPAYAGSCLTGCGKDTELVAAYYGPEDEMEEVCAQTQGTWLP